MRIRLFIQLLRPRHCVKNVIVLLPVVFARRYAEGAAWAQAGLATAAFCLASSAVYTFNDVRDRRWDQLHPRKRLRPVASGQVAPATAGVFALVLAASAMAVAWTVNPLVAGLITGYLLLQAAYSLGLKHKMLLDVMCIALGFVLRAVAGAAAIRVEASPWLVVCTFTLCLFLGFCKRRCELAALGEAAAAAEHRPTLIAYSQELLTHLITLSAGIAVVSFLLYASSAQTVERFGTIWLVYTLPAVIYGVFRFAMLSIRGRYDDPTELILRDRPFQLALATWAASALAIVAWGARIKDWITSWY